MTTPRRKYEFVSVFNPDFSLVCIWIMFIRFNLAFVEVDPGYFESIAGIRHE